MFCSLLQTEYNIIYNYQNVHIIPVVINLMSRLSTEANMSPLEINVSRQYWPQNSE